MPEKWFPLKVLVCTNCWLAQTEDYAGADELFSPDYAYFSSFSSSWLQHAELYVDNMTARFHLGGHSTVIEIAANDGYLLQYFKSRGIPCLGIEPTASTAAAARTKYLEIIEEFFGVSLAEELAFNGRNADLMVANNVLAHVPDINDFVTGFSRLLKPSGIATFEFPHLLQLIERNQFDTIYHEHFSYLSLTAVVQIFSENGLDVFDIEELSTHGGSLRIFAQRSDSGVQAVSHSVADMLRREEKAGMKTETYYSGFQAKADKVKDDFIFFLIEAKRAGKRIVAYGAAAKGNTLINYAGLRRDHVPLVVDRNPAKQGKFLPGSRIPIMDEKCIQAEKPDYIIILPWNLREEVIAQLDYVRKWGGKFVTAVPCLEII
jgi:ubiquinone/menaquinone biosynthesis C-methylase UbiE